MKYPALISSWATNALSATKNIQTNKTMNIDIVKHLTEAEQVRVQLLHDEVALLNQKITRVSNQRDDLNREITRIVNLEPLNMNPDAGKTTD